MIEQEMSNLDAKVECPYVLLKPVSSSPPDVSNWKIWENVKWGDIKKHYNSFSGVTLLAYDFETNGLPIPHPDFTVVGVGLYWERNGIGEGCYIEFSKETKTPDVCRGIIKLDIPLIAHNQMYDGTILAKYNRGEFPIEAKYDTLAMSRHLASEGWTGQRHGLKELMTALLGWPESNEHELGQWLASNGHYTSIARSAQPRYYPIEDDEKRARWAHPDKSQMYLAPTDILAKYCMLDCVGTYWLYTKIFTPVLRDFPEYKEYYEGTFWRMLKRLSDSHLRGITVDKRQMSNLFCSLTEELHQLERTFLSHPVVAPHVAVFNRNLLQEHLKKEPERTIANGDVSKNWNGWWEKRKTIEAMQAFNIGSDDHLRWLFYERLKMPIPSYTEGGAAGVPKPSTDDKALATLGPLGAMIRKHRELGMLQSTFVTAYSEKHIRTVAGISTVHPGWNVPGTITGRLSGKEPNFQQITKDKRFLDCFKPPTGRVWVDNDLCLHPKTELLTPQGWKNVMDLEATDQVWQVDTALQGSWCIPSRLIKKDYEGAMHTFGNRRGSLTVTEGHRMLWLGQIGSAMDGKFKETTAEVGVPSSYANIALSSSCVAQQRKHTDRQIWLAAMIQADASKTARSPNFHICVSKERKRAKVTELLGRPGSNTRQRTLTRPVEETWYGVELESNLLHADKTWNIQELEDGRADVLFAAISFWDGTITKSGSCAYSSTKERNVDQLQSYFVRHGYEAKKRVRLNGAVKGGKVYSLSIKPKREIRLRPGVDHTTEDYVGKVGCVTVDTGYILVRSEGQTFVTGNCALENIIAAEITDDPVLNLLYAPGSVADPHLHTAAGFPGLGAQVRKYYNPDMPTKEGVELAKKHCKPLRDLGKKINYSQIYGIGANKLHSDLELEGVTIQDENGKEQPITLEQTKGLWNSYWDTYSGVARYKQKLLREWAMRGGWIRNALGRPCPVSATRLKDLFSQAVQSGGHDILLLYVDCVEEALNEAGVVDWHWVIPDFHDECILECKEEDAEKVAGLMEKEAYVKLNALLDCRIPMSGGSEVGHCLTPFKLEE